MSFDNNTPTTTTGSTAKSSSGTEYGYSDGHQLSNYRGQHYRGRGRGNSKDGSYRGRGGSSYYGGYGDGRGGTSGAGRYNYYGSSSRGRGTYNHSFNGRDTYSPNDQHGESQQQEKQTEGSTSPKERETETTGFETENRGSSGSYRGSYRGHYRGGYRGRGGHYGGFPHSNGYDPKHSNGDPKGTSPRFYKDTISRDKLKSFNNPWINIMGIVDEQTQNKLEARFNELCKVDKEIMELQKSKLKLENYMASLEKQATREELHVQLTNEKLEEFTYL